MSGPPFLLPGESHSEYENLRLQVLRRAKPGDIIEEIWSADIVDMTWQIWRIHRVTNNLIADAILEVLPSILSRLRGTSLREDASPHQRLGGETTIRH
jgi:hypothetical protein